MRKRRRKNEYSQNKAKPSWPGLNHWFGRVPTADVNEILFRSLRYEELEDRQLLAADFGDAPSPYPTLESQDGPQHIATGPTLGFLRDVESNGLPASLLADGDESDEDGVIFEPLRVGKLDSTILVTVSNAPSGAYLDAWIDFDRDGSWAGANETIAASVLVVDGENEIQFDVPSIAAPGETYARFRLSTTGGLGPTGSANDGEVEDYHVTLLPPVSSGGQFGLPHLIASDINERSVNTAGTIGVSAADLDDDGDMDIIASAALDGILFWHENQGPLGFKQHEIARDLPWVNEIVPTDLDRDGDVDLVTVASRDGYSLAWHENDGEGGFQTHVLVVGDRGGAGALEVIDIDVDGDLDIIVARDQVVMSRGYGEVLLYRNTDNEFSAEVLATDNWGGHTFDAADIDRDGDIDIVETIWSTRGVNLLRQQDGEFTRESLGTTEGYGNFAVAAQLDDEGGLDILVNSWSDGKLRWLENKDSFFTKYEFLNYSRESVALWSADMNGDGQLDAIFGGQQAVAWANVMSNQRFSETHLVAVGIGKSDFFPVDMDGDGDLDMVVASSENDDIAWYENTDYRISRNGSSWTPTIGEDGTDSNFGQISYRRHGALEDELTITLLLGGEAVYGVDYTLQGLENVTETTAQLTFAAGSSYASLFVQPLQDSEFELDEIVSLEVLDGLNYRSSLENPQSVLIADDDPADFGDAPFPYPTTREANGPKHGPGGPRLGSYKDAEPDGQPMDDATGDDANGTDDEDGVVWQLMRVGQTAATLTVNVGNVSDVAYVDAWIDFDGDGNWATADERILASAPVVAGSNTMQFAIPGGATPGTTYARLRLSSAGGLTPLGAAIDGEVEDYEITISPPLPATGSYVQHEVDPGVFNFARSSQAGDIDGDGDIDIVVASNHGGITSHLNNGNQRFATITVEEPQGSGGGVHVELADIDSDGDLDILSIAYQTNSSFGRIHWFENDGTGGFVRRELDRSRNYVTLNWATAIDLDLDGDIDVMGSEGWYENDGSENFVYDRFLIEDAIHEAIDVDRDGDLDLVSTAVPGNQSSWDRVFGWYENDGRMRFTKHILGEDAATWVGAADIDSDGDIDIVANRKFDDKLSWYENDGNQGFTTHRVVEGQFSGGYHLSLADMEGDGDIDILATMHERSTIAWYANDGSGNFTESFVTELASHVYSLFPVDTDSDGDLDFVSAQSGLSGGLGSLVWHENVSSLITLSVENSHIFESQADSTMYVFRRSGITDNDLTVNFSVGGDATFQSDYIQTGATSFTSDAGSIYFPPGVDEVQIVITAKIDSLLESNETIQLRLSDGSDYFPETIERVVTRIVDAEPGDFGDAPSSYTTLLVDNGARHAAVGAMLGTSRDQDEDGSPTAGANGDDLSQDDEDGVLFGMVQVGRLDATVSVYVQEATTSVHLDAWIDFDGDGTWGGNAEQIASSLEVFNGENVIRFDVPSSAQSGSTYARVRLSSAGGLAPAGAAFDGEVEDYQVTIHPPERALGEFEPGRHVGSGWYLSSIDAADFDGDGDLDAVASGISRDDILWYENLGCGEFVTHTITTESSRPLRVLAVDIDSDGDIDVLATGSRFVELYENNGVGEFTYHQIGDYVAQLNGSSIHAVDLDLDGDLDILAGGYTSSLGGLAWYENTENQSFTRHFIDVDAVTSVTAGDFDRDGDIDIATGTVLGTLSWFKNDGNQQFTETVLESRYGGYSSVLASDIDGDRYLDLLFVSRKSRNISANLAWYRNEETGLGSRTTIREGSITPGPPRVSDLDGDGDRDIVISYQSTNSIVVFDNLGGGEFISQTIDSTATSIAAIVPGDFDRDGDIDLMTARYYSQPIHLYENVNFYDTGDFDEDGMVTGLDFLSWQQRVGKKTNVTRADGDANSDHCIDTEDLDIWENTYGHSANFDGDGDITGLDFLTLQRGYGISTGATRSDGDVDNDGDVDQHDLHAWEGLYGFTRMTSDVSSSQVVSNISSQSTSSEPTANPLVPAVNANPIIDSQVLTPKSVGNGSQSDVPAIAEDLAKSNDSLIDTVLSLDLWHNRSEGLKTIRVVTLEPQEESEYGIDWALTDRPSSSSPKYFKTIESSSAENEDESLPWLADELLGTIFG